MIAALADPETLLVFGVLAVRTSQLMTPSSEGVRSTPYLTPYGVMRETSLSRAAVEAAVGRLAAAGVLEIAARHGAQYESWRISEAALAAAATGSAEAGA